MRQPFFTRASRAPRRPRTVDKVVDLSVAIPADRTADPNIDMLAGLSTGRNADMSVDPSTNICPPTGRPTMPPERFFEKNFLKSAAFCVFRSYYIMKRK